MENIYTLVMIAGLYSAQSSTTIDTSMKFANERSCLEAKARLEEISWEHVGESTGSLLLKLVCVPNTIMTN